MFTHFIASNLRVLSHAAGLYGALESAVLVITVLMLAALLATTHHLAHRESLSPRPAPRGTRKVGTP
jgi:energy-converting hydrogenase Eha subunit F